MLSRSELGESFPRAVRRRAGWALRSLWGGRRVRREVQGVSLVMPWSHRLPDYAAAVPRYGQNLVDLAEQLATDDRPLTVLDIGANIGDSTVQILHRVDARVLCVEADDAYLGYLAENVGHDDRVVVERCLLVAGEPSGESMAPVRSGGTTRFESSDAAQSAPVVGVEALKRRHRDWSDLRLVKSDTDGHDVALVPAVAAVWSDSRPVLFFEFDPRLTRIAGYEPDAVWGELRDLGYDLVGIWDNLGSPVAAVAIGDVTSLLAAHDAAYWDVAVVHAADAAGHEALARLF